MSERFYQFVTILNIGVTSESGIKAKSSSCNATKKNKTDCECRPENIQHGFENIFVDPPDPLFQKQDMGDPVLYFRRRLYFWVPELFYFPYVKHIPCPECGDVQGNVISKGWNPNGPKLVASLGTEYFILTKIYKCNLCNKRFSGCDSGVVNHLPESVRNRFPCHVNSKTSMDNILAECLKFLVTNGISFKKFCKMYEIVNHSIYWKSVLSHLETSIRCCKNPFHPLNQVRTSKILYLILLGYSFWRI